MDYCNDTNWIGVIIFIVGEVMKIDRIIKIAEKTARKSPCRFKVSCILIDHNNQIVATGYNHPTSGRKMGRWVVHAEVDALNKVRKPSTNLTAFIYRKNGRIITPCHSCQKILKSYGISYIWHSAGIGVNGVEIAHKNIHT
jgi:deoxycytidylate deaminase